MRVTDETGNRYGRWVVVKQVPSYRGMGTWLCRCDCGTERNVIGASLRKGESRSCGCLQRDLASKLLSVNLVGQTFGRLTVISRAGSTRQGAAQWLCKCSCGNEVTVVGKSLRLRHTRSCGCLRTELATLPEGQASFNALFGRLKKSARERGKEWALTKKQVRDLTKRPCSYCGAEPQQVAYGAGFNGRYVHGGIDRLDNTKGYVPGNVGPCCKFCNSAKSTRTVGEFRAWSRQLYEHFGKEEAI